VKGRVARGKTQKGEVERGRQGFWTHSHQAEGKAAGKVQRTSKDGGKRKKRRRGGKDRETEKAGQINHAEPNLPNFCKKTQVTKTALENALKGSQKDTTLTQESGEMGVEVRACPRQEQRGPCKTRVKWRVGEVKDGV